MSEGDVSLIQDEDLLRRMWQQTEDFSRKKEIRAHMYRLREERLRNLYSPEPSADGKGCEFTSSQGHVKSFADQTFQSMKSKEVRDAGSPPKEFTYRGQDLKELSNAGWNVESDNRITDDGHTHVKSVNANIEGRYDVEGGTGQFAAVDKHRQAVTEYQDENSSLKRNESSSNTAAHEQVVRKTDDGTQISSSTTSSSSTSKFQQVSSKYETVPYEEYDRRDTNRNQLTRQEYENVKKTDNEQGELLSRKVEYPDDNTRVIVETRCLPDGTRLTSTRREFRAPVQSTRSEQRSQTRSESKFSSVHKSDESSSKIRHIDTDIVDSQRHADDIDFKNQISKYVDNDDYSETQSVRNYETNVSQKIDKKSDKSYSQTSRHESKVNKTVIDSKVDDYSQIRRHEVDRNVVDSSRTDDIDHTIKYDNNKITVDQSTYDDNVSKTTRYVTKVNKVTDYSTEDERRIHQTHHDDRRINQRYYDDKPNHQRLDGDKPIPQRHDNDKPVHQPHYDDKPSPQRQYDDKPSPQRHYDDKPSPQRHYDDKPSPQRQYDDKPSPQRQYDDKPSPQRQYDDKPSPQRHDDIRQPDVKEITVTRDDKTKNTRNDKVNETRDRREEIIEKKVTNEKYQTTYQTDYTQRKISTDWSPSHQAWASTLRSDTPSTTRPSTRASSPGSRTFKSSTSSLRSSVSPDKTHRKPSSRGGSPAKSDKPLSRGGSPIKGEKPPSRGPSPSKHDKPPSRGGSPTKGDRPPSRGTSPSKLDHSPTRTVSDRYSSTHTSTEVKTNRYTSRDGRPPTGRSPTRPGYSPDRPHERERPSVSPEKKPTGTGARPSTSPDRKPGQKPSDNQPTPSSPSHQRPSEPRSPTKTRQSPDRRVPESVTKPHDSTYPRTTSPQRRSPEKTTRPSQSPEKKPTEHRPSTPGADNFRVSPKPQPDNISKRPSVSPDRKPTSYKPHETPSDRNTPRDSVSPDRKPGYMRPTASSQHPNKDHQPTLSPEGTHPGTDITDHYHTTKESKFNKISEDHYKFVDEETKTYTRTDKKDVNRTTNDNLVPSTKTPSRSSPTRNIPESPRDQKPDKVTTEYEENQDIVDVTIDKTTSKHTTKQSVTEYDTPMSPTKREPSPAKQTPSKKPKDVAPNRETSPVTRRSPSPDKYGTYDKKKPREGTQSPTDVPKSQPSRETSPTKLNKDGVKKPSDTTKYNEPKSEREPSPSKFGTYNKKRLTEELTDYQTEETVTIKDTVDTTRRDKIIQNPEIQPTSPVKKAPRDSVSPSKSPTKDTKHVKTTDFISNERTTEEINKKTTKDHPRKLVTPSSSPTRKPKPEYEPSTGQSSPTTSVSGFVYFSSTRPEETITDLDDQEYAQITTTTENITSTQTRPDVLNIDRTSPSKIPCRSPSPEKRVSPPKENLPRKSSLKKPTENLSSPSEKPPSSFVVTPTDQPEKHKVVKKEEPIGEPDSPKAKPPFERRETYEDRCRKILGMIDTEKTETVSKRTDDNLSSPSVSPCRSPEPREDSPFSTFTVKKNTRTDVVDFITNEKDDLVKSSRPREQTPDKNAPRNRSPTKLQDITKTTYQKYDKETNDFEEIITRSTEQHIRKSPEKHTSSPNKPKEFEQSKHPKSDSPTDKPKQGIREPSPSKIPKDKLPKDGSPSRDINKGDKSTKPSAPCEDQPDKQPSRYSSSSPTRQPLSREVSPSKSKPTPGYKVDESPKTPISKSPTQKSPKESSPDKVSRYTTSTTTKYENSEDIQEYETNTVNVTSTRKTTQSPTRKIPDDKLRSSSPTKPHSISPERIPSSPTKDTSTKQPDKSQNVPGYMKTTAAASVKHEYTSVKTDTTIEDREHEIKSPSRKAPETKEPRDISPGKHRPSSPRKQEPFTETRRPDEPSSPTKKDKFTKTVTSTSLTDENNTIHKTTKTTDTKYTSSRVSTSPTRHREEPVHESDRPTSPKKSPLSKDTTFQKRPSPTKEVPSQTDKKQPKDTSPNRFTSKTSVTTKYDSCEDVEEYNTTRENIEEYNSTFVETKERTSPSVSPTRKLPHDNKTTPKRYGASPEKEPGYKSTPSAPKLPGTPGFTTTTESIKQDRTVIDTKHTVQHKSVDDYEKSAPNRQTPQDKNKDRDYSPSKSPVSEKPHDKTPKHKETPSTKAPVEGRPKSQSPDRIPGYLKSTTSVTSKHDTTYVTQDAKITTNKHISRESPDGRESPEPQSPKRGTHKTPEQYREPSPSKPNHPRESDNERPREKSPLKKPTDTHSEKTPKADAPNYMKPTASVKTKHETVSYETDVVISETEKRQPSRSSTSPSRHVPSHLIPREDYTEPEEPRQLRTPSPIKKITSKKEVTTDFIMSEREQEVLNKVQKSLRKLSPERKSVSPTRERSPSKTTASLHDLDIVQTKENVEAFDDYEVIEESEILDSKVKVNQSKEQKIPSKPSSRNVSPTKKSSIPSPSKTDKTPESPTKSRSISPKKPISERPRSPQVPKAGYAKPKEMTPSQLTRKPTPATITTVKLEKAVVSDAKRAVTTNKQVITKTTVKATASKFMTPTTKNEPEQRRTPILKDSTKKEPDSKVTRTTSDTALKSKKTVPQRVKSKPEIQVSDMSSKSPRYQKPTKEPQTKFPTKPKSATALNTSSDDSDVIIDVGQSKSSRENSPDRICPTPVNFNEDDSTPRFPDEVSEPDDDFRRHTHHTIHETESLVDDIVEICEEDELFVKKNILEEDDESDIPDRVSKPGIKPKDTNTSFIDKERRGHTEYLDEQLKTDECLLSVTEKVNKFAKGPKDTRDSKSPMRRIVDEYDKDTIYQDDYTKLSVNDKAHLFVETAENVNVPKTKPAQKVGRPDLSNVDESLKSDDCLLSVSDKVNKFVKTAEQFLTETHVVEEKEKKIKEQHEKIMKKIVSGFDDDTQEAIEEIDRVTEEFERPVSQPEHPRNETPEHTKEQVRPQGKLKDLKTPTQKPTDRAPVKITTLRSSEAVKKAKALFENIASTTQKTKETKTKLTDIGVNHKTPKSENVRPVRPKEEHVHHVIETEIEVNREYPTEPSQTPEDRTHRPTRSTQSPTPRPKSPSRHTIETVTTKTTKYSAPKVESPKHRDENDKPDNIPGYLRPTKTSQLKEETVVHDADVSSRRGSGKFGVELRRTSVERVTTSSERRRSVEHPCIEDIFDVDLLEQMLEKVAGYEQRRRIRAQIREAKKLVETHTKTMRTNLTVPTKSTPTKSPDRSRKSTPHKTASPERRAPTPKTSQKEPSALNGHPKEPVDKPRAQRPHSPEKVKTTSKTSRQSPEKKVQPQSPTKATPKTKPNRFNEYASAYMKKVGLNEKASDVKKTTEEHQSYVEEQITEHYATTKTFTERSSSRDVIETSHVNGKRSPSPEKRQSPQRTESPVRRSPSPEQKRQKPDAKKETIIKTVYNLDKKVPSKPVQEEKPSWVTNRNLKKVTSETRTFSSKKIEPEKPKYRAPSPSKVISKPLDVITSSYGPGPLDADGKPLFGIKALRKGSSNYQGEYEKLYESYVEYADISLISLNVPQAIRLLDEVENFVENQQSPPEDIHKKWIKSFQLAKICSMRGACMLDLDDFGEARKQLLNAMQLYYDPIPTSKYLIRIRNLEASIKELIAVYLPKIYPKRMSGIVGYYYEDIAFTLNRLYQLFSECKEIEKARLEAKRALNYALKANANFRLLCFCYGNMIAVYREEQNFTRCLKLKKQAMELCHRKRGQLDVTEVQAVCYLYTCVFLFYMEYGKKKESLEFGLTVMPLASNLTDLKTKQMLLLWLLKLLLSDLRIKEMVNIIRDYFYITDHYDLSSETWYYFYAIIILLDTGYCVESYTSCEKFYIKRGDGILRSKIPEAAWHFFVAMWLVTVRLGSWEQSIIWEEKIRQILIMKYKAHELNMFVLFRLVEGLLITLVKEMDNRNNKKVMLLKKAIKTMFRDMNNVCCRAPMYRPRYYLLYAYFLYIKEKKIRALIFLKKGHDAAVQYKHKFLLIWIEHTRNHWRGVLTQTQMGHWIDHLEPDSLLDYMDFDAEKTTLVPFTLPLPREN